MALHRDRCCRVFRSLFYQQADYPWVFCCFQPLMSASRMPLCMGRSSTHCTAVSAAANDDPELHVFSSVEALARIWPAGVCIFTLVHWVSWHGFYLLNIVAPGRLWPRATRPLVLACLTAVISPVKHVICRISCILIISNFIHAGTYNASYVFASFITCLTRSSP